MAFDPIGGGLLLFGGTTVSDHETRRRLGDTWRLDGQSWSRPATPGRVPALSDVQLVTLPDGEGVLLHGTDRFDRVGEVTGGTWRWDGRSWQELEVQPAPRPRSGHALVRTASGDVFLYGNLFLVPSSNVLWAYRDGTWTRVQEPTLPPWLEAGWATYEPSRETVLALGRLGHLTGGTGADWPTWSWNGERWESRATSPAPSRRGRASLVHDAGRGVSVFLQERLQTSHESRLATWEWDGSTWEHPEVDGAPRTRPPGVVFDAARGVCLVVGSKEGEDGVLRTVSWTWDGETWTELATGAGPPPRWDHALAYDPEREVVVLYGGRTEHRYLRDTWEWDGRSWREVDTLRDPGPRTDSSMVYDPRLETVLLRGGRDGFGWTRDLWAWSGSSWQTVEQAGGPERAVHRPLVYDEAREVLVLVEGEHRGDRGVVWEGRYVAREDRGRDGR